MDLKRSLENLFTKSKAFDPASQQFMSVPENLAWNIIASWFCPGRQEVEWWRQPT